MKYKSKKDETIIARIESKNEKYGTVTMTYETGDNAGKSFDITTSTFKRWWSVIEDDEKSEEEILKLDMNQINEPYPEPKEQKYIPKPQSVIEYEEKKKKGRYNFELPEFDAIVAAVGSICVKVNENSKYVKLNDNVTTIWRKSQVINIYACESTAEKFVNKGLMSRVNKDKDRPFAFDIKTREDFEKVLHALTEDKNGEI